LKGDPKIELQLILFYDYFWITFENLKKIIVIKNYKNKILYSTIFQYVNCVEQIGSNNYSLIFEILEREVKKNHLLRDSL
jgi:hypothetical protein